MLHTYVIYEVESGDSMLDICTRFRINYAQVMNLNPEMLSRDMNKIQVGELIRIQ